MTDRPSHHLDLMVYAYNTSYVEGLSLTSSRLAWTRK